MTGEWLIGSDQRGKVALKSNADGWTEADLAEVAAALRGVGVEVQESSRALRQKSAELIPWLVLIIGPFFAGFFGKAGADTYDALKALLVEKARRFEKGGPVKFHKYHFNGEYKEVMVSASINARTSDVVQDAVSRRDEVLPIVDAAIVEFGANEIEVLNVIYTESGGKWVLNEVVLKDGKTVRGSEYHLIEQDVLRDLRQGGFR